MIATIHRGLEMSARHLLLLPVAAVLIGLSACDSEASTPGPTASAPTSAAAATGTASASPAAAVPAAGVADCPSAATLQKLVELPKGGSFGSVQCVKDWAGAAPQGPKAGDGVYLFHFVAGTGWKYYGEGSGYDCKDLGLNEPAPFCIS
ncbi:hypothetical protein [Micromonospora matsumotoense]|uniref:hypothetical protein n=1 Tax=Micromonospora matsumotoense TaxID=121616 RepID=UPI0034017B92